MHGQSRLLLIGSGVFSLVPLVASTLSPLEAATYSFGFQSPSAAVVDSSNHLFVADRAGVIKQISITGTPTLVGTFGSSGSGDGQLNWPDDLGIDASGNIAVADTGNRRIVVFTPSGSFVRNVAVSGMPQRVALSGDGSFVVLTHTEPGIRIQRFTAAWNPLNSFDVDTSCGQRTADVIGADLAVDANGKIWVAENVGCGPNYVLRRFNPDGSTAGTWTRASGQLPEDVLAEHGYNMVQVADIFTSGSNLYVVLGTGGAETGGLDVDVWTTAGAFIRRSTLVGPARPMVRGFVSGGQVFVPDTDGTKAVVSVPLSAL